MAIQRNRPYGNKQKKCPDPRTDWRIVIYSGIFTLTGTLIGSLSAWTSSYFANETELATIRLKQQLQSEEEALKRSSERNEYLIVQYKKLFMSCSAAMLRVTDLPTRPFQVEQALREFFSAGSNGDVSELLELAMDQSTETHSEHRLIEDYLVNIRLIDHDDSRVSMASSYAKTAMILSAPIDPDVGLPFGEELKKQVRLGNKTTTEEKVDSCLEAYVQVMGEHLRIISDFVEQIENEEQRPGDLKKRILRSLSEDPALTAVLPPAIPSLP